MVLTSTNYFVNCTDTLFLLSFSFSALRRLRLIAVDVSFVFSLISAVIECLVVSFTYYSSSFVYVGIQNFMNFNEKVHKL